MFSTNSSDASELRYQGGGHIGTPQSMTDPKNAGPDRVNTQYMRNPKNTQLVYYLGVYLTLERSPYTISMMFMINLGIWQTMKTTTIIIEILVNLMSLFLKAFFFCSF